jgi:hypothetical protein
MKRLVCIIILLSMVLHCASRLGVISYLYTKRHAIAYNVGLIAEIPIAMCHGDYHAKQAPLILDHSEDDDQQMPVQFSHARELQLFVQNGVTEFSAGTTGITLSHNTLVSTRTYLPPNLPVFHPPCERIA